MHVGVEVLEAKLELLGPDAAVDFGDGDGGAGIEAFRLQGGNEAQGAHLPPGRGFLQQGGGHGQASDAAELSA